MKRIAVVLLLLFAAGCASSPAPAPKPSVHMDEPRRIVGTENDVRLDAEIVGEHITPGAPIPIRYVITNQRSTTILVADLLPQTNYDPETGTVTIEIGTEIPGQEFLPRLIAISSGEKRSFTTKGVLNVMIRERTLNNVVPRELRLRLNFLGETTPFEKLINIPEKAVHDPQLASDIFTKWVEGNETVVTNAIPMRWGQGYSDEPAMSTPQTGRRRRGTSSPP